MARWARECRGAAANSASARLGKHAAATKLAARGAAERGEYCETAGAANKTVGMYNEAGATF